MVQRIVVNKCFGGYSLSPKATKMYAKLKGKECYFFKGWVGKDDFKPVSEEEIGDTLFWTAFSVPNPEEYLPKESRGKDGLCTDYNNAYEKIDIDNRPEPRDDPDLLKVVEKLGDEANGNCAKLEIVEIPDGVEWEIDEYDGSESIDEVHRSW